MVDIKELASAERKYHALIVFLQLVIYLRSDQSRKLPLGKRLILVQSLTVMASVSTDATDRPDMLEETLTSD